MLHDHVMTASNDDAPQSSRGSAPFTFSAGPFPAGRLRVLSFRGREAVSRPFRFDLVVAVDQADAPDLEAAVLGQPASLAMLVPEGDPRCVCGIVAAVEAQDAFEQGRHAFRLRLVPRLWLLGKRRTSRIFQNRTVPQIVDAVLDVAGVARRWALVDKYPPRTYCVQYQETDLAFVTRLLAEEGIFYVFEHDAHLAEETVVLSDSPHLYDPIAGDPELAYRYEHGSDGLVPKEHHVGSFSVRRGIKSGAVLHRDYDFLRPLLDLRADTKPASSVAPPASSAAEDALPFEAEQLRVYDHRGEDERPDVNAGTARVRLEQHRRHALLARGESACRRLLPGFRFDLVDHEIEALNRGYVVARVDHEGRAPEVAGGRERTYTNAFTCVPADMALRPKRSARVIKQVVETALVVGPGGEEIYTDEHGRVKVQFPWDLEGKKNEHSSCWVRVSQAWAGAGWGFEFIPRVGMEVVVTFVGGDVDRPLITGCVPNAVNVPPFALPANRTRSGIRTRSSPGGHGHNELSFEDRKGAEQLYLHAQRDLDEVSERNHTLLVRGDERLRVLGGRTDVVEGDAIAHVGRDVQEHVAGSRTSQVEGNRIAVVTGNSDERVSGVLVTRVDGKERRDVKHNADLEYAEDLTTRVRGCMTTLVGKHDKKRSWTTHAEGSAKLSSSVCTEISSERELVLRVGKSSIRITSEKIEIDAPMVTVKGKGGGLSASDDGLRLTSKGDVQVRAEKKVVLKAKDGASLSLQKEVKVDGDKILLNSPESAKDAPTKEPEPPTKVELVDDGGKPLGYQRFLVSLDDGSEVSGITDSDGKAELDLKSGGKIVFADVTVPGDAGMTGPMAPYVVRQGDYLAKLADRRGFDADEVWKHPKNEELKKLRKDHHILATGDVVFIPTKTKLGQPIAKGAANRYAAKVAKVPLKLCFRTSADRFANVKFKIDGGATPTEGATDGDGRVELAVSVHATEIRVSFPDLDKSFKVFVGHMDPVDELSGVKARLIHLGYLIPPPQEHLGPDIPGAAGPAEGDDEALIKAAVRAFQKAKGLAGNGEVDADTRAALVAAHGS